MANRWSIPGRSTAPISANSCRTSIPARTACNCYRYAFLGVEGYHDNCTDNLFAGMSELGLVPPEVPSPLNLFMNIPWSTDGALSFATPPRPIPGGYVRLRAEMDLVIAFSACPQDILPINGKAGKPVAAHFAIAEQHPNV